MNITKTLKRQDTVYHYSKLLDLFQDNDSDFLQSLTEDELIGIDYALDFEQYQFLVVNFETVIVIYDNGITGIYDMEKFKELTKEVINE